MKAKELKHKLDALLHYDAVTGKDGGEKEVVIVLSELSAGPLANTKIRLLGEGIDWDHNKLLIYPEDKLVRREYDVMLERKREVKKIFHELWTNAVDKEGYDKKKWQKLEGLIGLG